VGDVRLPRRDERRPGRRRLLPDDLALAPDGRHAFVLTSGRAEGSADRPAPALDVYELGADPAHTRPAGRLTFEVQGDDPVRLALSATGRAGAVTLMGSNSVAAVDLSDPAGPRLIGRSPLASVEHPYPSRSQDDWIVMPVASGSESVVLPLAGFGECVASTLPHGSGLGLYQVSEQKPLGRLRLRGGKLGLSETRPTALAYSPERALIAVANRAGGYTWSPCAPTRKRWPSEHRSERERAHSLYLMTSRALNEGARL